MASTSASAGKAMITNGTSTSRRAMPTPNTLAKLEDPRAWHARGEVGIQKFKPSTRASDAIALVMAPPPPKGRPVAAKKVVLEEDEYVERLGDIIEGDYFPHNAKMQRALLGLAQDTGNSTPSGRGFIGTPSSVASLTPGGATPGRESGAKGQGRGGRKAAKKAGTGGALTEFVATHTSEDNQAFAELQEKDQEAFRRRYFWAYENGGGEGNNATSTKLLILPDGKMMSVERREQMDAACADRPKIGDHRPNQVETWKHRTRNQLMFSPNLVASRDTCRLEEEPAPAAQLLLTGGSSKSGTKQRLINQAGEVGKAARVRTRRSAAAAAAAAAATAAVDVDDGGGVDDANDDANDDGDNDDDDDDDNSSDSDSYIDVENDDDSDDIDIGDDTGDPLQSPGAVGIEHWQAVTTAPVAASPASGPSSPTRDQSGTDRQPRVAAVEQPLAAEGADGWAEESVPASGLDDVPESPQPHGKAPAERQPTPAVPRAPVVVQTNVKTIQAHATRFPVPQARPPRQGAWASPIERPSSSRESVAELLAGNADAPDYAEVPMTPSRVPGLDGDSPQITWGSIDGTPMILDPRATPLPDGATSGAVDVASMVATIGGSWGAQKFEVKDLPPRDKLAHRLEAVDTRRKRAKLGLAADGKGKLTPVLGTPLTPRTPGTGRRTPGTARTPGGGSTPGGGRTPGKGRPRKSGGGAVASSTPAARALAAKLALRQSVSTPFGGGLTPGRQKKRSRSSKGGVGSRGENLTPLPSTPSEGGHLASASPVVSKEKSGRGAGKRSSLTDGLLALK